MQIEVACLPCGEPEIKVLWPHLKITKGHGCHVDNDIGCLGVSL